MEATQMNKKRKFFVFLGVIIALSMITTAVLAEDGVLFRRNVSKTPDMETEKAAVFMMDFYVPAQGSDGIVGPVDNYCLDEDLEEPWADDGTCAGTRAYEARDYAKPLVSAYIDGVPLFGVWEEESVSLGMPSLQGGIVLGAFDAFIGVSLDDGTSWRTENLSRSADLSSFTLDNGHEYPGGVHAVVHQVAEDKIFVAWASKYCQSGYPLYSLMSDLELSDPATVAYLADLEATYGKNAMYLYDLFGVAGSQGSVDYTEQGFLDVGEVPYSCIWTARGKLLAGDDPNTDDVVEATHVVWTAPERLTSGARDANLPAVDCAKNAGCALTWQEDPEGLRPGQGLGPGEGWSGAIANAKTDIWYSFISFADFDVVAVDADDDGTPDVGSQVLIEDYEAALVAAGSDMDRPKPYVPMAMPVRLTDNDMCKGTASTTSGKSEDPFCWLDFDTINNEDHTTVVQRLADLETLGGPEEGADFCSTIVDWTNPGGTTLPICVTEDGRYMIGRVASTRVRMAIKPYTPPAAPDHDADGILDASAWLSLAAEETKALGITVEEGETYDPIDIGKDMFYYSFDIAKPYNLHVNTELDVDDPSPYVVQQGGMINQPALCSPWFITTEFTHPDLIAFCGNHTNAGLPYPVQVDPITGYEYYLTEIARRFAITLNNIPNITNTEINQSGLAGMLIYKQGIINQGGPADIFLRRLVVPDDFDATVDNPFAFENMDCTNPDGTTGWVYPADVTGAYPANPYYLEGLCTAPAINISGSTIAECAAGGGTLTDNNECAAAFPVADDGTIPDDLKEEQFPKVKAWRQTPYTATSSVDDTFTGDPNDPTGSDLDDQSWENPYDVAKGHRGFLYGDYVMMMYAWSPNWKSNTVGNDHYNLYQRRSFDGGLTWTTAPADCAKFDPDGTSLAVCDGLDALEFYYGDTTGEYESILWTYGAGEPEQAHNLSLLTGNKVTILDPRYSPPGGLKQYATIRTDWVTNPDNAALISPSGFAGDPSILPYTDDATIDPSKYFLVYETGDNTTVDVGEAIPLDLYYSRATDFGDTLEWFDYANDPEDNCVPGDDGTIDWAVCLEPRWPWLENKAEDLSGEASVVLNPGGTFAYNVWNQWREEILPDGEEFVFDSDMIFRRLLYLPDDSTIELNPLAAILYLSEPVVAHSLGGELVVLGTGREIDHVGEGEGIVEYLWTSDLDGTLGSDKILKIDVTSLTLGTHTITFKVKDNDGVWSADQTVKVIVLENLYQVRLPLVQY
jgi:hypothetical protein